VNLRQHLLTEREKEGVERERKEENGRMQLLLKDGYTSLLPL